MPPGPAASPAASPAAPAPNTNPDFTNSRRVRRVRSVAPITDTSFQLELGRREDGEPARAILARVVELLDGAGAEHAVELTVVRARRRRHDPQLPDDRRDV